MITFSRLRCKKAFFSLTRHGYAFDPTVVDGRNFCGVDAGKEMHPSLSYIQSLQTHASQLKIGALRVTHRSAGMSKAGYICENPEQGFGCPEGYTMAMNKCYKVVGVKRSWMDAEMVCRSDGATLARPASGIHVRTCGVYKVKFVLTVPDRLGEFRERVSARV